MTRLVRLALAGACLLSAACERPPARSFVIGLAAPVGPRDAAAAGLIGLEVVDRPPQDAALERTESPSGEHTASWARLRWLGARAAAEGRSGVIFVLPTLPRGRELADYPEEWQALARASRELVSLRPVLEDGGIESLPGLAEGLAGRAWRRGGRRYAVLVNVSSAPVAVPEELLSRSRALFEARADAREVLPACPAGRCLPPGRALWLEGRLVD